MKNWNEEWRDALHLMDTHAKTNVVMRHLSAMLDRFPEFTKTCPHCGVTVGPCVTPSGRPAETHSMRLTRAGVS